MCCEIKFVPLNMEHLSPEEQLAIEKYMKEREKEIASQSTQHTQCMSKGWHVTSVEGDVAKISISWTEASYGDRESGQDFYNFNYKTGTGERCSDSQSTFPQN